MGLMDKMKAQASQLADKAQEAGKMGQAKVEELQARRRADTALRELGRIAFRSATDQESPEDEAKVADLVEQIRQFEAQFGSINDESPAN